MAPEVLAGKRYDCAADVYSFGIILWELLTWQIPWEDLGPWQVGNYDICSSHPSSSISLWDLSQFGENGPLHFTEDPEKLVILLQDVRFRD